MSRSNRTDREPCPWRIFDDAGGAFVFGNYIDISYTVYFFITIYI